MSSTTIGVNLKKQILSDMDLLLGRGRTVYPCPLGQGERRKFWHNCFDKEIVVAFDTLERHSFPTRSMTQHWVDIETSLNTELFRLYFTSDKDELLQDPKRAAHYGMYVHVVGENLLSQAFPGTRLQWLEFINWADSCAKIHRDFTGAYETLAELLKFCGTVGQLTRAVPELRTHLPGKSQSALNEQTRASNMPFEWATFDRDRVRNLQLSMCKAFLFPKNEDSWGNYQGTWARYA